MGFVPRNAPVLLTVSLLVSVVVAACNNQGRADAPAAVTSQPAVAQATAPANLPPVVNEQQKGVGSKRGVARTRVNACSLIKSDELLAVQGETPTDAKLTESTEGSIATGHCIYILPTYSKSLSLSLTQRDASQGEGIKLKDFWEERFRAFEEEEKGGKKQDQSEREREREKKRARRESAEREREGEEEAQPVRVTGIGEEAFWVGNRMLGALYVFSNNSMLRLSLGGPEDEATKISKLKVLARKAIKRL